MPLTMINCDLSQAELRVMALLSNDEWMMGALQEGEGDFFDNHMMPVCFPWIERQYGTVEKFKEFEPNTHKESRTKVKGIQYGLAFGREARAIGKALGMSTQDAQRIIDTYLDRASGFAQWREDVKDAAVDPSKRDLLINPFGRKFQSEVITNANYAAMQREALSFLPQSTSSDICLSTGIRINDTLKEKGYHIFNIVHDALMIEGPANGDDEYTIGAYVARELRKTGQMVFGDRVPFLSDFSIGDSWADLS